MLKKTINENMKKDIEAERRKKPQIFIFLTFVHLLLIKLVSPLTTSVEKI